MDKFNAADVMTKRFMLRVQKIFFVGIGGVGMSAIAEVLLNLGYEVIGSDRCASENTKRLQKRGANVFIGHAASNVANVDVVVSSSAIASDNPELCAARENGIPIIRRAEMLAELMRFRFAIAVAGTHGKTTTTSLITSILADAGLDPTFVIGGVLASANCNARLGNGCYMVAEADESDASFLHLQPMMSVITNIDADHLETYGGSYERLKEVFVRFVHQLPFYGLAILCVHDEGVAEILDEIARPTITYGFDKRADFYAQNIVQCGLITNFEVVDSNGGNALKITLNMPGKHNVLNALAAIIAARELGLTDDKIAAALRNFKGVDRRFSYRGKITHHLGNADVFEDYGHHPSEIKAAIMAAKEAFKTRRLVVVFQPHRFTRTRDLFDDFAEVLSLCEALILLDVYEAGEEPIIDADSRALARAIRAYHNVEPLLISDKKTLNERLLKHILCADDVLLYLGAGDVGKYARDIVRQAATNEHEENDE